jgi:hypothetical protein
LEDSEKTNLTLLSKPTHGKLINTGKGITYQPEHGRGIENGNIEDRFTYATGTSTAHVNLQLQTEAGQRKIAHILHDALLNHDAPVRLTVKAAKNAPTLIITDPITSANSRQDKAIALPTLDVIAYNPNATLTLNMSQLPQGGTISDGKNTFTVTETSAVDVTGWNLKTLSLRLPSGNFEVRILLTFTVIEESGSRTEATSASIKISAIPGNGSKRPTHTGASIRGEIASTKTASITVHSVLPDPDAKPKEMEVRYHVLNLASSRASSAEPKHVIDWTGKAPDREISSTGWMPQLFASTKEKVRSLAEITGLFFPSNREERP